MENNKKAIAKIIDAKKVLTLILTYPDNFLSKDLMVFFMSNGFDIRNIGTKCEKGYPDVIRNKFVKEVKPMFDKYEWVLFADNDMHPNQLTHMFLIDHDADVVACNYDVGPISAITPESFHMGMVRVRVSKLKELMDYCEKNNRPLFAFTRNPDNTEILDCECSWFRQGLEAVGARIMRIGFCNHFRK
jgi:hypothetical protein